MYTVLKWTSWSLHSTMPSKRNMRPPQPGVRLSAAASLVRPGSSAADIGCDHGRLAVHLVQSGRCPFVIAADLRPGPLQKAQALAQLHGVQQQVSCRLGDGLSVVQPGEVQDIVIAGMGGGTIADILAAAPWVQSKTINLVLLPTTQAPELRCWLYENGFVLQREVPVLDGGYCYTVQQAAFCGQRTAPTPLFCQLGLLQGQRGAAALACLQKAERQLEQELQGRRLAGETGLGPLQALADAVKKEREECQG